MFYHFLRERNGYPIKLHSQIFPPPLYYDAEPYTYVIILMLALLSSLCNAFIQETFKNIFIMGQAQCQLFATFWDFITSLKFW